MNRRHSVEPARLRVFGYLDLATCLLFIFPLLLAYQIGVVFASTINGVDFVTHAMFALVDHERGDYLLLQLALCAVYVTVLVQWRRRGVLVRDSFLPMLLESSIYALTLGSVIIVIMQEVLGFSLAAGLSQGAPMALRKTGESLIVALGAGVYEELVFRLGVMAGGAAVLTRLDIRPSMAIIIAAAASAVLFSLAHHSGAHGEPFELAVFTYRLLAGGVFCLIFYYRSLAHAVYTHFLYDLYVLTIQS